MIPDWLSTATILEGEVGSRAFGTNPLSSDNDRMGVCIEPLSEAMGIRRNFEQVVYRTAQERTGVKDAPSQEGDTDLTVYSLRKFARLCLDGNPSVLTLLFVPDVTMTAYGSRLRNLAPSIASKRAGARFLGYMTQQKMRLLGERGQKNVNRAALVGRDGFDSKYASHIIRLGYQGVEYLETGALNLPMTGQPLQDCIDIRAGKWDLQECLTKAGELEVMLKDALSMSILPELPNEETVNAFVLDSYEASWSTAYQQKWGERG